MEPEEPMKSWSLLMPPKLLEEVNEAAHRERKTMAEFVRNAIRKAVEATP